MTEAKATKRFLLDYPSGDPRDYKCASPECKGTNKLGTCKCCLDRALDDLYPPVESGGPNP